MPKTCSIQSTEASHAICAYALHAGGYPLRDLCVRKRLGSARTLFPWEDSICLLADVPARPAPE
jgi:hypothetical protein